MLAAGVDLNGSERLFHQGTQVRFSECGHEAQVDVGMYTRFRSLTLSVDKRLVMRDLERKGMIELCFLFRTFAVVRMCFRNFEYSTLI